MTLTRKFNTPQEKVQGGRTLLAICARKNPEKDLEKDLKAGELLLDRDAAVHVIDPDRAETALMSAIRTHRLALAEKILAKMTDRDVLRTVGRDGYTAQEAAAENGATEGLHPARWFALYEAIKRKSGLERHPNHDKMEAAQPSLSS